MFGECHAHLFMNGINYKEAVALHKESVQEKDIREKFQQYKDKGISFVREGGDVLGVSSAAARIAPEYGITYCSPVFAIHRNGHYGGIVGYGFDNRKEYYGLVKKAEEAGADFIKVMFSGIMDFGHGGHLTEEPLEREDIFEMIHIAHEEGFAVMAHVNGPKAVLDAVEAGVDSVEHGNFMDEDALHALSESHAVWVPTYVTITNLIGSGRFDDEALERLKEQQGRKIKKAYELGAKLALGSDAGAFCVPHGQGLMDEYREFKRLLGEGKELDMRLQEGEEEIKKRFMDRK